MSLGELSIRNGAQSAPCSASTDEQNRLSRQLAEMEKLAGLGSWFWEAGSATMTWSPGIYRILGMDQGRFAPGVDQLSGMLHPDDRELCQTVLEQASRSRGSFSITARIVRPGGEIRHVFSTVDGSFDAGGRLQRIRGTAQDITDQVRVRTERDQYQAQLHQSQKMEAIGRLTGGVAHDFNNLLTVIQGYAEIVHMSLTSDDPLRTDINQVISAADSAASLTRQLLAFSRQEVVLPKRIDLNQCVAAAEKIVRRVIGEEIELIFTPAPDIWPTRLDPSQVGQIIINLAVNARDAMPGPGTLTLETANVNLNAPRCHFCPQPMVGDHVRLRVTDTGSGIEPEVLGKIFDPFFTTRESGRGTGLGLSTITGIIHQAGGHILAESTPGKGTTFTIHFPRATADSRTPDAGGIKPSLRGHETCLLVEDEEMVRNLAARALRDKGYTVLTAADGDQALEMARENDGRIALLITDVILPGMNGRQLFEQATAIVPGMNVLYISGYDDSIIAPHGVLNSRIHFLQKPFRPHDLTRRVRRILDAGEPGQGD